MFLPHQIVGQHAEQALRHRTFAGTSSRAWSSPPRSAIPGWFGPGSAVWHVHSHMQALIFGLQCAAYIERLDPSIYWMGMHHSRLVKRDESRDAAMPVIDPKGASVRLGHSVAFFIGTAYGSTETAERLAHGGAVDAPHHQGHPTRRRPLRRRRPRMAALELRDGGVGDRHRARALSPEPVARQEDRPLLR